MTDAGHDAATSPDTGVDGGGMDTGTDRLVDAGRETNPDASFEDAEPADPDVGRADASLPGDTVVFELTRTIETYTVPAGVTSLRIVAEGASGGAAVGIPIQSTSEPPTIDGGHGARVEAVVAVHEGQRLSVIVGEQPDVTTGSRNDPCGGSGGGGTFLMTGAEWLVVSGGGGGAGGLSGVEGQDASLTSDGSTSATSSLPLATGGRGGDAGTGGAGAGGAGIMTDGADVEIFPGGGMASGGRSPEHGASGGARNRFEGCTGGDGGFGGGGGGGFDAGGGGGGYSGGTGTRDSNGGGGGGGGSFGPVGATIGLRTAHGHGRLQITAQ